jgi:chromosome segregation ATPase
MLRNTLEEIKVTCSIKQCEVSLSGYSQHLIQCKERNKLISCWNCGNPYVYQSELKMKSSEYNDYLLQLNDSEIGKIRLEDENQSLKLEISRIKKEVDTLNANRNISNLDRNILSTQHERIKKELEDVIKENKDLNEKLSSTSSENERQKKKIDEQQKEIIRIETLAKINENQVNNQLLRNAQTETNLRVKEEAIKEAKG